jgi:hypothetical protein
MTTPPRPAGQAARRETQHGRPPVAHTVRLDALRLQFRERGERFFDPVLSRLPG